MHGVGRKAREVVVNAKASKVNIPGHRAGLLCYHDPPEHLPQRAAQPQLAKACVLSEIGWRGKVSQGIIESLVLTYPVL